MALISPHSSAFRAARRSSPLDSELDILEELNARQIEDTGSGLGLEAFTEDMWGILEPGNPLVSSWYLGAICEHLAAMTRFEIMQQVITMPPRHLKSTAAVVMWPTWEWGPANLPHLRWIFSSYAQSLSLRDSGKRRRLMGNWRYRRWWGDRFTIGKQTSLDKDIDGGFRADGAVKYENDHSGYHLSTSVKGSNTGEGGDRVVVDDAHNMKEIFSDVIRQSVIDWWGGVMHSRINNPKRFGRLIIGQRGHEVDLPGHVLDQGGYVHLNLPLEWEPKPFILYPNALPAITRDPRSTPGELLCEARIGRPEVASIKLASGSYVYNAQYQQHPAPPGGFVFKLEDVRYWVPPGHPFVSQPGIKVLPSRPSLEVSSWDFTFKDEEMATSKVDYTVGQHWWWYKGDAYLRDQVRKIADFSAALKMMEGFCARWPKAQVRLIEDAANGPAILSALRKKIGNLIPVPVSGDSKLSRAFGVQGYWEAHHVYLPHPSLFEVGLLPLDEQGRAWVVDLISEVTRFPASANDDCVDAMAHALLRLFGNQVFSTANFG